ncbi:M20 family metallopeptidase [Clostridium sediminicola]|uniref:M20 metallopeptidase family protein n=1 Tax=Clostridium sediminicola TaxID=3114879 RepID=UPI0031F1F4CC
MNFLEEANNIKEEVIRIRRDLHMYPELNFDLFRTSEKVKEFLKKENIEYYETAKTGICAIIKGNGDKTVALRADMDALPIQEVKETEYISRSENKMHACGHDVHTAILMGAAKILNGMKEDLKGNVKLLFEPAEETTGGAQTMIDEGVLNNPEVSAVFGIHVEPEIEVGKIGIKRDVVNAASNPFTIKIIGKGGHGAYPHRSIDPIVIASNVVTTLQNVVSREISAVYPAVISIGTIKGGTAQNIIPEFVEISGIMRTMTLEHRKYVKDRLVEITEGICTSMRAKCEIQIDESYPCLYNDDKTIDILQNAAEEVIGKENVIGLKYPAMGVESFAYFSLEKPSAFYFLGTRNESKDIIYPLHNSKFDVDEECMVTGIAIQCKSVVDFLNGYSI